MFWENQLFFDEYLLCGEAFTPQSLDNTPSNRLFKKRKFGIITVLTQMVIFALLASALTKFGSFDYVFFLGLIAFKVCKIFCLLSVELFSLLCECINGFWEILGCLTKLLIAFY